MNTAARRSGARPRSLVILVCSTLVLLAGALPSAAVTIDDFSTGQSQLSAPPDTASSVGGMGIIGGQRDLELSMLTGAGPATVEVAGGLLVVRVPDTSPDSQGRAVVTWDGDTDPDTLDPVGLGGIDLTAAGDHTGFVLTVDAAGAGVEVVVEVHTDGANASRAALMLPSVAATSTFVLSYSSFVIAGGTGADFTNVGAITMSVTGVEQDLDLTMIETAGPVIALGDALKADLLVVDNDGDGRADPGDTLRYTITVTNTGAEATSVNLDDVIQPNLAVVADSLFTGPIAAPDTYAACGNVLLAVDGSPALPGLTANDHDPDGEAFTISTAFPVMTDRGGTVDNVDPTTGTFDYVPPAGFRGVDAFSYEIRDAGGRTNTASVTLMVDSLVWFVDSGAAAGGTGTQTSPFNTLGGVEAASGPGDIIFVYAGSGDTGDGIVLQDDQQLIGEGAGLLACGTQVVPPGTRPTLVNSSSTVVRLANGNRIAGLDIEPAGSEDAIVGSSFDGLEVEQVGIDTSRGAAGNGGVDLTGATGVVGFDQLAIVGTGTGTAFSVVGGNPEITVANSSLTPMGGRLLNITGTTGGTVDFQASSALSLTGGAGDAVTVQNNTAIVTLADLGSLSTAGGGGLLISNNDAVTLGAMADITAAGGPALDITTTAVSSLGGGTLSISSLSSTASPNRGVRLDGVAPDLVVAGNTSVASAVADGISLSGANGSVTFASVDVNTAGLAGLSVSDNPAPVTVNGGTIQGTTDAVELSNASSITLVSTTLSNNSDSAVTGAEVTDLVLASVIIGSSGDAAGENSIDITNMWGALNAFTNCDFTASATAERLVRINNLVADDAATDVLTVASSTFRGTFASPVGADLLEMTLNGAANLRADITGSTFIDSRTNGVQMLVEDTSVGVLNITMSTFTNQGAGIDMGVANNGSLTFDVSNNPTVALRSGSNGSVFSLVTDDTATAVGKVTNNPNIAGGGSVTSGIGVRCNVNGNSTATVLVDNNTISNIGGWIGIDAIARGGTGRLDSTITNNTVTVDLFSLYDIRTQAQDNNTVCANVANNTASGVTGTAYRQRTSDSGSTVLLQGFTTNATITWNNNGNTPVNSVSSINSGSLGGGTCNTVP